MMNQKSNHLKPTCREVHRLVPEPMEPELSLFERPRVRLHLLVCTACTRFRGQTSFLRQAMRRISLRALTPAPAPAPAPAPVRELEP